jgi:transcriptional regulator with XRE-family HTH domain
MTEFNREKLEDFLATVRKYMQLRGPMSQKDLAERTDTGVSTMSRFLGRKTADINPQLVAKIVANLDIPLSEVVDFVEEGYWERFRRLVSFYKGESAPTPAPAPTQTQTTAAPPTDQTATTTSAPSGDPLEDALVDTLSTGTAQRQATATVKVGNQSRKIPFNADMSGPNSETALRDKLAQLSPRQKAYVSDFLSLDMEARDLIVDLGNDLFRYFRQKGMIA